MLLDLIIVALVVSLAGLGAWRGAKAELVDLAGFAAGVLAASALADPAGRAIRSVAGSIDPATAKYAGAAAVFLLVAMAFSIAGGRQSKDREQPPPGRASRGIGAALGGVRALALATLLAFVYVALPSTAGTTMDSRLGYALVRPGSPTAKAAAAVSPSFRELSYYAQLLRNPSTYRLEDGERLALDPVDDGTSRDPDAEVALFEQVNADRVRYGLGPLVWDQRLADVAAAHSADMYRQGYFAHDSADGRSPFDRIRAAEISYTIAGENLGLAPTPEMAHRGLINSPGHRENILDPEFRQIGIGVVRGPYGLMVSEEFTG